MLPPLETYAQLQIDVRAPVLTCTHERVLSMVVVSQRQGFCWPEKTRHLLLHVRAGLLDAIVWILEIRLTMFPRYNHVYSHRSNDHVLTYGYPSSDRYVLPYDCELH